MREGEGKEGEKIKIRKPKPPAGFGLPVWLGKKRSDAALRAC